jgi:ATP phosphoribosyltransferase regulatory subunit
MLGIRADITPQAARIDAHRLRAAEPARLCYIGTVLHTLPDGFGGTRSPLQIGAELYGHAGIESDVEILCLMMATLDAAGVTDVHLDLGHVGVYRGLARAAGLTPAQESGLFDALQRKAEPEIRMLVRELDAAAPFPELLLALAELNGGREVIAQARARLGAAPADVLAAIDYVEAVARRLADRLPQVPVHVDLAELRAYHYQTGVVFAAFVPGEGEEIARGGRYDDIGREFGRARPATGFSADLKTVLRLAAPGATVPAAARIHAPAIGDTALERRVDGLRAEGRIVVRALPGLGSDPHAMGCAERLVARDGSWIVEPV